MIPYHDENETQRPAYVAMGLIALNVLTWLVVQGAGSELSLATSVCNYGLIAGELTGSAPPGAGFPIGDGLVCQTDPGRGLTHIITSMFLHGSWMHLIGNMWFLWLFGNNVEDSMTRGRFLAFYLLCGLAAALLQVATDPTSIVPMVGASGAISGIMGAYLLLVPARAGLHLRAARFHDDVGRAARLGDAAVLGVHSIGERGVGCRRRGHRRRRILGSRRRVRGGSRADQSFSAARLRPRAPAPPLAAPARRMAINEF